MDTNEPKKRTRVRAYPPEFKAKLVAEAERPGASVAQVALAHGLNANMLHTWRREARATAGGTPGRAEFVALPVATVPAVSAPIRIELRHGNTSVAVSWPTEAADACAGWLRELLR
jgi:transposase